MYKKLYWNLSETEQFLLYGKRKLDSQSYVPPAAVFPFPAGSC